MGGNYWVMDYLRKRGFVWKIRMMMGNGYVGKIMGDWKNVSRVVIDI